MRATLQWRREMRQHTAEMLDSLGRDSADVAARLKELGVRGVPGDPGGCAIAVFLSAVVTADPSVKSVKVMPARVVICPARGWRPPVIVGLSECVRNFIAAFDRNAMPDLVRERPTAGNRPVAAPDPAA